MATFWDENPAGYTREGQAPIWERLFLNGNEVPGLAEVTATRKRVLDIPKPSGSTGRKIIGRGFEAARVSIAIKTWTPDDHEAVLGLLFLLWERERAAVSQGRDPGMNAVRISHAAIDDGPVFVSSIIIESMDSPVPGPERGSMVIKIKAVEYTPDAVLKNDGTKKASGPRDQRTRNFSPPPRNEVGGWPDEDDAGPRAKAAG